MTSTFSAFVWALLAACCWGVAPVVEKLGLRGSGDPVVGVFVRSIGVFAGTIGLAIFTPKLTERLKHFDGMNWTLLVLGGLMASILGQIFFYRALKAGEVSRVTPIGASYPVLAFLLGVLFLGESLTWTKGAGLLLVMTGVYLLK